MWGLGNIAGDSTPLRDAILNKNGMDVRYQRHDLGLFYALALDDKHSVPTYVF